MPTLVSDILNDAALLIGAVQLGESLTSTESSMMLALWQRLIDSFGLSRANIHTVRQDTYTFTPGVASYTLGYDPRATARSVSAATNAASAVLTVAGGHGITVGRTNSVVIAGATGNWVAINGAFVATALTSTTLSIPVDSTAFGALAGTVTLQVAGVWSNIRPTRITEMNLGFATGIYTPITLIDQEQEADIMFLGVSGPPLKAYYDSNSPLGAVIVYPTPDSAYQTVIWSEQALESVGSLALSATVAFAQGYERYWSTALALEVAPRFGLEPSATLVALAADAAAKVQSKNRRSPLLKSDPELTGHRLGSLYNWRIGMSGS